MNRLDKKSLFYCAAALAVVVWLVTGARGLGPLDDHNMFSTLFQGKPFGFYIAPDIGRFFPLTAQEFVIASKIYHPSAALFYLINVSKLVFCGIVLYRCLVMTGARTWTVVILWSVAIISVGTANTLYRLSAGELSLLCTLLCVTWSALYLDRDDAVAGRRSILVALFAITVFVASMFYKELAFVFGVALGTAEYIRHLRLRNRRMSPAYVGLVACGLAYVVFYSVWRFKAGGGSYADLHAMSRVQIFKLFAASDPFMIFVAVPIAVWRIFVVVRHAERHMLSDSLLLASVAYLAGYFILDIVSPYYLLPAYAFAIVGVAGTVTQPGSRAVRALVLGVSALGCLNTLPVFASDVLRQKQLVNNHFRFVTELSSWLNAHPPGGEDGKRNLVLEGVSPGGGIEIIESLRIYLTSLGVSPSTFDVVGSEPTNNPGLSTLFKVKSIHGYKARIGDLEIFNPYRSDPAYVPPNAPSIPLVVGNAQFLTLPRWSTVQWAEFCFLRFSNCAATLESSRIDTGYSAYLYLREPRTVELKPLRNPSYRLAPFVFPATVEAGERVSSVVTVENTGEEPWPADIRLQAGMYVHVAYRWFDEAGMPVLEGDRAALPEAVFPREKVTLSLLIKTPMKPGRYRLQIGPLQEGVAWFEGDAGRWSDVR